MRVPLERDVALCHSVMLRAPAFVITQPCARSQPTASGPKPAGSPMESPVLMLMVIVMYSVIYHDSTLGTVWVAGAQRVSMYVLGSMAMA